MSKLTMTHGGHSMARRVVIASLLCLSGSLLPAAESIETGDGLALRFSSAGKAELLAAGKTKFKPGVASRPLFRVREMGAEDWTPLVGAVERAADGWRHWAVAAELGLALEATVRAYADRIEVKGALIDTTGGERSALLMCALPGHADALRWGLDIMETADPLSKPVKLASTKPQKGDYTLWIDAYDFDPEMASISVVTPTGDERLLAVLGPPGSIAIVNDKWRVFVVSGVLESDFKDGRLRVKVTNPYGGPTNVLLGGVHLMDAKRADSDGAAYDDERATTMLATSCKIVLDVSLGSWRCTKGYGDSPEKRNFRFLRDKTLRVSDARWVEIPIDRGKHRVERGNAFPASSMAISPDLKGLLSGCGYPWATLTQAGAGGYSVAVSPEMPCLYKFQYDALAGETQLILSYGLSALPKHPDIKSRAPFHIVVFRTDDNADGVGWGFREAAQRFYSLAPELFKRPTDRFGFWYGAGAHYAYRGLDGLYAYLEVYEAALYPRRFLKDRAEWEEWKEKLAPFFPKVSETGILVLPYRHFYHTSLHVKGARDGTLPHMPETYGEAVRMLKTVALPFGAPYGHYVREVIESSTMRKRDGKMDFRLSPKGDACSFNGRVIFRTTVTPHLYDDRPEVMTNARMEMDFAKSLLKEFPDVGGIYYDAGAGGGGLDHDPEHLRYARSPLAPGPSVSRIAGKYEFGRWMGNFLHAHGKIQFVNGGMGMNPRQAWHIMPFDCIGIKHPPAVGGERDLRFLRTLAGRKPVSFLVLKLEGDAEAKYREYAARLGALGVFATPRIQVQLGGNVKRALPAAQLIAPFAKALQDMYLAGWRPVTHARSDNPALWVERYGPAPDATGDRRVYFALYNPTQDTIEANVHIETRTIAASLSRDSGVNAPARPWSALDRAALFFASDNYADLASAGDGRHRLSVSVPAKKLVVAQLAEKELDDPGKIEDFYPSKARAAKPKPALVGKWDFEEGKGQTVHDTSGAGAHALLGSRSAVEDSDPQWAPKGHTGGALRFDGRDDAATVANVGALQMEEAATIEAWIKPERRLPFARVVDCGPMCIYADQTGQRFGFRIGGYSVNTAWSKPVPLSQWTHLKASYDAAIQT